MACFDDRAIRIEKQPLAVFYQRTFKTAPGCLTSPTPSDILTAGGEPIPALPCNAQAGLHSRGNDRNEALVRWLMIALLVSVVGLLTAALGMARHIWVQRSRQRLEPGANTGPEADLAEEIESEVEH
jgi:hypothetical protein